MSVISPFIGLASAVAAMLNAESASGGFSRQFTAQRIYDPMRPMETLETMAVDVILGDKKCEPMDRQRQKNTVRIEVCVRQVIRPAAGSVEEQAALDELVNFVEEIDNFLSSHDNRRPPLAQYAGWQDSELVYPFLPKHLRESRQFTSLLRQTYFVATS